MGSNNVVRISMSWAALAREVLAWAHSATGSGGCPSAGRREKKFQRNGSAGPDKHSNVA